MSVDDFAAFFEPFGIRHFRAAEFLVSVDRPGNHFPAEDLWPNILPTAWVLDEVRAHFGSPLVITSCFRAPDYNRQVGGTVRSNHQAFTAADFGVAGVSPADVADLLRTWRDRWFRAPARIRQKRVEVPRPEGAEDGPSGEIPFAELIWREGLEGAEFQLAGGVGEYARFTHFDTRGLNHTWKGH